jgi:hypothetical protein
MILIIENGPERIVIHWRYIPDIELLERSNEELNVTLIEGFTSAVHELFTIYPDGRIERLVKNANGTTFRDWNNPGFGQKQEIQLKDDGIIHGSVDWGELHEESIKKIEKSLIIDRAGLPVPSVSLTFDEGGGDYPDMDFEEEELEEVLEEMKDHVVDYTNLEFAPISGHGAVYKKGVSGTSLAFDGYYTGIIYEEDLELEETMTLEAWVALDVFPYNDAPIIQRSERFGENGFYLGIDAYGNPFMKVNGAMTKSDESIPLYTWTHIAATIGEGRGTLYIDGKQISDVEFRGDFVPDDIELTFGLNTEKERCTDYVRDLPQNLPFIYGIQGLMDEVKMYNTILSSKDIKKLYSAYLPDDTKSALEKAVLPGEVGKSAKFGASYKTLKHHELWDKMWRLTNFSDIVVKFENSPTSVVYWHGTNYAANWVTDNNRWMADQSSEIFTDHGCSEHMADKQCRHSYARIIENNDARVIVHWRYPCVDVGYVCTNRRNWTDEYHTIYPDGTGIRKVVFNNFDPPGFQDIQFFTNPGETALDVVHMNAVTVANVKGDSLVLQWEKPNKNPEVPLEDATIEWLNSKSKYKVFAIYQGTGISTWGSFEQSKYTYDPFAGPWNHWPISVVPSDGRFAVAHDRVTHFALGANDAAPEHGAMVHYGFTNQGIQSTLPFARYWQDPPEVVDVEGARNLGFSKAEKAYAFRSEGQKSVKFKIDAGQSSPLVNPSIVLYNCESENLKLIIDGEMVEQGKTLRIGKGFDTDGIAKRIIWLEYQSDKSTQFEISFE